MPRVFRRESLHATARWTARAGARRPWPRAAARTRGGRASPRYAKPTLLTLARSCHPGPVVAVTTISGILAYAAGRAGGTIWVVLAVLAGQLFIGWSNDYLDRDLDRASYRKDKPVARGDVEPRAVGIASAVALVAAIPLSLASGLEAALVHMAAIASATAYNLRLKATPLSPLPYALSFALLPAFITLGLSSSHWPPPWVMAAAALIGVGGHFAQARPDVTADAAQRVRGLPQLLGERMSGIAAAAFLAAGAVAIAAATRSPIPLVAVVPATGVAFAKPRPAFLLTLATAIIAVAAFIATGSRALASAP